VSGFVGGHHLNRTDEGANVGVKILRERQDEIRRWEGGRSRSQEGKVQRLSEGWQKGRAKEHEITGVVGFFTGKYSGPGKKQKNNGERNDLMGDGKVPGFRKTRQLWWQRPFFG